MEFTVTTAHGTSTQTYAANGNIVAPGQGVIQGGGASSPNFSSQQHPVLLKGVSSDIVYQRSFATSLVATDPSNVGQQDLQMICPYF